MPATPKTRHDRELWMTGDEAVDLTAVLRRKHGAGDVGESAARLYQRRSLFEHGSLLGEPCFEHLWREPPFRVGPSPPDAGAGAGRIDDDAVHLAFELGKRGDIARVEDLDVARPRPFQPLEDWTKAHAAGVISVDLAAIVHGGCEAKRLATGAGAKIEDLLLRPR